MSDPHKWTKDSQMVPFNKDGNMQSYAGWNRTEWRPNSVFQADLRFVRFSTGRSSARAIVCVHTHSGDVFNASMLQRDFGELLRKAPLEYGGWVKDGTYTFGKRGANYFMKPVEDLCLFNN